MRRYHEYPTVRSGRPALIACGSAASGRNVQQGSRQSAQTDSWQWPENLTGRILARPPASAKRVVPPLDPPRSSGGFDEGAPAPTFEFSEPPRIGSTSVTTAGLGDRRSGPAAAVLPRALHNAARVPVTQNLRRRFGLATSLRRNTRGEGGQDCACVVAAAVPVGAERAQRARRRTFNPRRGEHDPLGSRAESQGEGKWLVRGVQLFEATPRLQDAPGQPSARMRCGGSVRHPKGHAYPHSVIVVLL